MPQHDLVFDVALLFEQFVAAMGGQCAGDIFRRDLEYRVGATFFFHGSQDGRYALALHLCQLQFLKKVRKPHIAPVGGRFPRFEFFRIDRPRQASRGFDLDSV